MTPNVVQSSPRVWARELAQSLVAVEVNALVGTGWGEVMPERVNCRDGFRPLDPRLRVEGARGDGG